MIFTESFPCLWLGGAIRVHRYAQKNRLKGFLWGERVFFGENRRFSSKKNTLASIDFLLARLFFSYKKNRA